jgi:hypothetical protein
MVALTVVMSTTLLVACGDIEDVVGAGNTTPVTAPATTEPSDDVRAAELVDRRERWHNGQPAAYRFTVQAVCFCVDTFTRPRTITVENGQVVAEDPPPGAGADPERVLTVDDLFDRAEVAIEEADAVEIDYDNDFDFPATIAIDDMTDAIDDEITYAVTGFEVVEA